MAPTFGPEGCHNGHFCVLVAPERHVLYRYSRRHDTEAVDELLPGFKGYLVADGHVVYDHLYRTINVVEVGCWARTRRPFHKAMPSWPKSRVLQLAPVNWKQTLEQPETQQALAHNVFRRNEMVTAIEADLQDLGLRARASSTLPGPSEPVARLRTTPSLAVPVGHQETVVMYLDASKALARGSSAAGGTSAAVRPTQGLLARVAQVSHQGWKVALAGAVSVPLGIFVVWIARPLPPKAPMDGDKAGVRQWAPIIEPLVPHETFSEPSAPPVSAPQPSQDGVLQHPVISSPSKQPASMRVAKQTSEAASSLEGQGRAPDRTRVLPRSQAVKRSPPVTKFPNRAGELSVDDF